ncbi:MAG: hypothetical protein GAK29_02243 [Acinetobacter bereziniae]|uniref:Uncharacterized protein n=1 Tax=Acinetobacter bereziniae TaxID=106648 RepID=A0A833PFD4_ACIBZ|nr:MAG: hypothetical protein GAK29_02243 [Acinetobacter bereziniae]
MTPTSVGGIFWAAPPASCADLGSLLQPTSAILVARAQAVRAGAQSFADIIIPPRLDSYLKIICSDLTFLVSI